MRARSVVLFSLFAWAGVAVGAGERCHAIDGATLECGSEYVQIEGLRAPAIQDPGGRDARNRLERRIQSGELILQRRGRDKWGRTHARAFVNGNRITQLDLYPPPGASSRR